MMCQRKQLLRVLICFAPFWIYRAAAAANESDDVDKVGSRGPNRMGKSGITIRAKPFQLENNENEEKKSDEKKRYIVKYKQMRKKVGDISFKVASRQNSDLLKTAKVLSLDKSNADVVILKSESELAQLQSDANVEYVEEDHKYYVTESSISASSRSLSDASIPYGIDMVNALEVDATNISNRKVCIIDSGYDLGHSDLQTNDVDGYNGDSDLPWDEDTLGHGTHVVGTIAALGNNKWGVTGVIPNGKLKIHIIRVFGSNGYWAWGSDLAVAMYECADANANVINMSLGTYEYSAFIEEACKDINTNYDVLLVASAGNSGYSGYNYPASYDNVMSVAAIDENESWAYFSTYNDKVDIAAPGVDVLSTVPRPFGSYDIKSGTSMSAPHVTGVAALVWSHFPSISAKQLQNVLQASATDLGTTGRDDYYGHGLINAKAAYDFLADGNTFSPTNAPTGLDCAADKKKFDLKIVPDYYDYTTTWELREACSGDLKLDGGEESKVYCVADVNYVFTIYDSWGQGLCCDNGQGSYELYFDGELIKSGGEFSYEESVAFGNSTDSCSPSQAPSSRGPTPAPTGLECEDGKKKFDLEIVPDADNYQATWTLAKNCTGEIILSGEDSGTVACVDDLEYDFTISEYNGLCCSYGSGYYDLYFDDAFIKSGGYFYGEETVSFGSDTSESCAPTFSPTGVQCEDGKKNFDLKITMDRQSYSYQTSWKLRDACSGDTLIQGDSDGYTGCVDDLEYNFTIYDYNGLCCWYGEGSYEVYYDGSFIKRGSEFEDMETVKFGSSTSDSCAPTMAPTGLQCPNDQKKFLLQITPDSYPYKNDWWLRNYESRDVIQSGDAYDEEVVVCLNDSSMYEFVMTDDWGYGLCCSYGDGMYTIHYDGQFLRRGTDFGSKESTVFGSIDDSLNLGFVGVSSPLDNSTESAFLLQVETFLKNKASSYYQISMSSVEITLMASVVVEDGESIKDGVQDYGDDDHHHWHRDDDDHHWRGESGRVKDSTGGLLVYLRITADMSSSQDYISDDTYLFIQDGNAFISRIFAENWNDFERAVMPIVRANNGNRGTQFPLNDDTNKTLVNVFIAFSSIALVAFLVLSVMMIKLRRQMVNLREESATASKPDNVEKNNDTFENNVEEAKEEEDGFEVKYDLGIISEEKETGKQPEA